MRYQKKMNTTLKMLAVMLAALVLVGLVAGVVLWVKDSGGFARKSAQPLTPTVAEGPVRAMHLPTPDETLADETALRGYYRQALEYAVQAGYNTLVVDAKTDAHVWWRDDAFPTVAHIASQDRFFRPKLDPIGLLCEEAEGSPVQLWLRVDPYAAGTPEADAKGPVADLLEDNATSAFAPDDKAYAPLLAQSLASLPRRYPVAGVVLTGFTVTAENPVADIPAWQEAFATALADVSAGLQEQGAQMRIHLGFDEASTLITPDLTGRLLQAGSVRYLLPAVGDSTESATWIARFGAVQDSMVVATQPAAGSTGLSLFIASSQPAYAGVQLGSYPAVQEQEAQIGMLESTLTPVGSPLPTGYELPKTLQINYPTQRDGISAWQEGVYVMGNSDPSQPLLLNGEEVARGGTQGTFGVFVPLQDGENVLTFSQGGQVVEHVISRPQQAAASTGGGGEEPVGEEPETPGDTTQEAEPGQAVQMVTAFTGGLNDPHDDGNINETYYNGAVGVVQASVLTERWDSSVGANVLTWAYQLTGGDYVLARNCRWVDNGQAAFTGIALQEDEAGRGEWLAFEGSGTPAAVIACEENVLSVTMYDTGFSLPEGGFSSALVQSAEVEQLENGVTLRLKVQNTWGWQIDYSDGQTRLFLKRAPTLGDDPLRPLAGTRVLLDPGHGGDDMGAPGIMGGQGPNEKHLNLDQAQAIAYRLQQLGAEVTLTRTDDTFVSLNDRLQMMMDEKPDFFIAVHHNSATMDGDRSAASGMQVYHYTPSGYTAPLSATFGKNLMNSTVEATVRSGSDPAWGYFTVTRAAVCPAVLYEFAFMVSPVDFEDASSASGLYAAAFGIADGITETVRHQGAAGA